jgi:arylsulfatase A-like enzyme
VRYLGLVYRLKDFLSGGFDPPKTLTEALHLGQDFSAPTFTYIHVGLPHDPYMFRSDGEVRLGVVGMAFRLKSMTQRQLDEVKNWYLEQVAYTDQLLGIFLAQLKELNLYEQSLIIVTSDHGVSFDQAHPWRSQQWIDVEEIGRVPFLVKMPGQHTGWIDDRQILNIELHKMILNVLEQDH